jgi:hypothetical protein
MADVPPTPHEQLRGHIRRVEAELAARFEHDAGRELDLADDASALLALVMSAVGKRTAALDLNRAGEPSGDITHLKLTAMQFIGVRALRTVRAARASLAVGYEPETRAQDRILVELVEHRREILTEDTGKTALDWLKGKRGRGISGRVAAMQPADLYKSLSQDSHGDPTPVTRLVDPATETIKLEPVRTNASRASLLMYAGFCRDQAAVIAALAGIQFANLPELDDAIREAWEALGQEDARS